MTTQVYGPKAHLDQIKNKYMVKITNCLNYFHFYYDLYDTVCPKKG